MTSSFMEASEGVPNDKRQGRLDIDSGFLSLPLNTLADATLSRGRRLGAQHVAFRCDRIRRAEVRTRDGKPDGAEDQSDTTFSVRVLFDGGFGFASSVELSPDEAVRVTDLAVEMARISARLSEPIEFAGEPVYREAIWVSSYDQNPMEYSEAARLSVLTDWSQRLLKSPAVDHVYAKIRTAQENKFYADSANTVTNQQRVRIYPQVMAISLGHSDSSFETMRTVGPPAGRGWEYVNGVGWDWNAELAQLPDLLAEKTRAPSVQAGTYDLLIDASNLWLTIHETIGHATELDRVLGHEAAFAGTSFASFDQLGALRYGSELMNVTGDRTVEHGLATVGFDDEGVAAQKWDIVRAGVLVGYQLDRRMARLKGLNRSNGCAFAESGAFAPLQRMANISLLSAPAGPTTDELIAEVKNGIYVVGDRSWSIDMQRSNFQFTGQRFFKIEHGRLAGQVRNAGYSGTTVPFWNSLVAVGGESSFHLFGADYCGKAQPVQIAAASHGCPAALFRGVNVINSAQEAAL